MTASTTTTSAAHTSRVLTTPVGSLSYLKSGSGPALVIVHGIGGHKEDWRTVMQALESTRTVYAIDMIGFGSSDKTPPQITIKTQVEAVRALLLSEGIERADVLGNSVGGWVAATFAATYPEQVIKLVLVDAAGFKAMFDGPSPVNFYPDTIDDMQKLLSYVLHSEFAHTREFAQKALADLRASGDAQAGKRVFEGLLVSPRLEEVMPRIKAPTLVVWGANDKLFPPAVADLVSGSIAGSRKVLIDKAGHFPQVDNPAAFNAAVIAFLML
jgi:2-hydroxy-6-oxonona-2,4-dienedioate hydrolase